MHEGETVWVEAPVDHAPHGTCVWCGEAFEDAGDFRCIAMLTKDEDGDADWLSGEFIHGTTAPTRPMKLSLRSLPKPRRY